jgi:uncharacterized membrane protein YcaP (DUF421 family)
VFGISADELFLPESSFVELFIRGSVMYLALFFLFRLVLKRQAGGLGVSDVLLVVLVADAAANGMAGDYTSIPEGLVVVGTIVAWSFALDWAGYHFRPMQRLIVPGPLPLVRDGRLLRRNMRQELITEGELMASLRQQGVEHLEDVHSAFMEGDGTISVITRESHAGGNGS